MKKAPEEAKAFFQGAMASVNPYIKAGKFKPFTGNIEVTTGVRTEASHGHTAGHNNYVVESKGKKLVLIGDLIHSAAVQFPNPKVAFGYDGDPKAAVNRRMTVFNQIAKEGAMIGATHLPFPGVGRIRADKKAFVFVPINYSRYE